MVSVLGQKNCAAVKAGGNTLARLAQNEKRECSRRETGSRRGVGPLTDLLLKRAATSRPSGEWNEDDYDVLADGDVVGRIYKANATPVGSPWMWTLAFWHQEDRTSTHGYAATREAAMAAFAKSWRRG
jgi:hypothetical protein